MSIAAGAIGDPTPEQAIATFLKHGELRGLPTSGWARIDSAHFASGAARLEILPDTGHGYFVTSASTC